MKRTEQGTEMYYFNFTHQWQNWPQTLEIMQRWVAEKLKIEGFFGTNQSPLMSLSSSFCFELSRIELIECGKVK